jgi:hypothetical protein
MWNNNAAGAAAAVIRIEAVLHQSMEMLPPWLITIGGAAAVTRCQPMA